MFMTLENTHPLPESALGVDLDLDIEAIAIDGVGKAHWYLNEDKNPIIKYRAISNIERTYAIAETLNTLEDKEKVRELLTSGSFTEKDIISVGLLPAEGVKIVTKFLSHVIFYGIKDYYPKFDQLNQKRAIGVIETFRKPLFNGISMSILKNSGLDRDTEDRIKKFRSKPEGADLQTNDPKIPTPNRSNPQ